MTPDVAGQSSTPVTPPAAGSSAQGRRLAAPRWAIRASRIDSRRFLVTEALPDCNWALRAPRPSPRTMVSSTSTTDSSIKLKPAARRGAAGAGESFGPKGERIMADDHSGSRPRPDEPLPPTQRRMWIDFVKTGMKLLLMVILRKLRRDYPCLLP